MAGAIDMRVVALLGRVFDVARRDGQNLGGIAPALAFRCFRHLIIADEVRRPALGRRHFCHGGGERRLAVIPLTNGPPVAMRLCPCRELRSPITEPVYSSGVTTSTFMIGSSRTDPPFCNASRNAARAQISNASAEESTS